MEWGEGFSAARSYLDRGDSRLRPGLDRRDNSGEFNSAIDRRQRPGVIIVESREEVYLNREAEE